MSFAVETAPDHFEYYFHGEDDAAVNLYSSGLGSVMFDNLVDQVALGVEEALDQGYALPNKIAFAFIQGQQDARAPEAQYAAMLETYIDRLDTEMDAVFGKDMEIVFSVSQTRSGSVGYAQLEVINDLPEAHLGALEAQFQGDYPTTNGARSVHLNPTGYNVMGQHIGVKLYDALTGQEDLPMLISNIEFLDSQTLRVTFSGVEGHLIEDLSSYRFEDAPADFGFTVRGAGGAWVTAGPQITTAVISAADQVELHFDKAVDPDLYLYLGNTRPVTTLADSDVDTYIFADAGSALVDQQILEFAPSQYAALSDFLIA